MSLVGIITYRGLEVDKNNIVSLYGKDGLKKLLRKFIIRYKSPIATFYIEKKNYEQAITLLLKLNKSALIVKDSITKARVIDNLGAAYFKSGKPHAIQYLKKALEIRQRIGKPKDMLSSYLNFQIFMLKPIRHFRVNMQYRHIKQLRICITPKKN